MSRQSELSKSVLTSSESDRDPAVPLTSTESDRDPAVSVMSVYASSDLVGDIDNLSLEPCNVCQRKASSKVNEASWYCQECKELLCHECKDMHSLFVTTLNHVLIDLHPPCAPCAMEKKTNNANWYCMDCSGYLCQECTDQHKKFAALSTHTIISSLEKAKIVTKESTQGDLQSSTENIKTFDKATVPATKMTKEGSDTQTTTVKESTVRKPYSRRTAKFITAFDATIPSDSTKPLVISSAFLPDSKLLLVDSRNKSLKVFDNSFRFVIAKTFDSTPMHVSVYDSSEVALVTSENRSIIRLAVHEDINVTGTISLMFDYCAVAYVSKDKLVVTSKDSYPGFFCVYNTSGRELSRTSTDAAGNPLFMCPFNVAVDRQRYRAYVSDYGTDSLNAFDLNKESNLVFTYKHAELTWSNGITLDNEGNIYVCCTASNNIHQISPLGEHIRLLLSKKDGLTKCPRTICFSPGSDTFVIGNDSEESKILQVFKMEY